MAGLDVAGGVAGELGYLHGEVVPAAHALVAEMIDAAVASVLAVLHNVEDGQGEVEGIGRGATLIKDHFQLGLRGGEIEHGLHKILAKLRVEPGRAQDDMVDARGLNLLLAVELGEAVDAGGGALLVFLTRHVVGIAAKHIIGAHVHEESAYLFHHFGQILGGRGVEGLDDGPGGLGGIDIGPCGAVDDAAHTVLLHHLANVVDIGDVELGISVAHIGEDIMVLAVFRNELHLVAQLSVGACYKNVHCVSKPPKIGGWGSERPATLVGDGHERPLSHRLKLYFRHP